MTVMKRRQGDWTLVETAAVCFVIGLVIGLMYWGSYFR
jgi:hypothetical protein